MTAGMAGTSHVPRGNTGGNAGPASARACKAGNPASAEISAGLLQHCRDKRESVTALNFKDVDALPDEKATDDIEMRVKPSDKGRFSKAAELTGVKLATFVKASASREAERILREHRTAALSERDSRTLLEALDNPLPSKAAMDAVRDYRSRIANAG